MEDVIDRLIGEHDEGHLSRRDLTRLLVALTATVGSVGRASAQEAGSTFRAVGLNHIALDVTDVGRSRDFYVEHLGLEVASESPSSCFLRCGKQFVALFRRSSPGMNHYCYSIEGYDVEEAAKELHEHEIEPRITSGRIYFPDPDGLTVQLAAPEHGV